MASLPSRSPLIPMPETGPPSPSAALRAKAGGAEGSRTPDLLIANETLYQLSYDPIKFSVNDLQSN